MSTPTVDEVEGVELPGAPSLAWLDGLDVDEFKDRTRSREMLLMDLRRVGHALALLPKLYEVRDALYGEARAATPPVKVVAIAEAALVTEDSVHQSLRKLRAKSGDT